jgi:hypothetical protein
MTSTQPGQPDKKLSRGQRAAGAAALLAVAGAAGWAVAAGPLAPTPEPTSRSVQAGDLSSTPPAPSSSGSAASPTSDPELLASKLQAQATEVKPAPGSPGVTAPTDPGAAKPPAASGKIINEPPPVAAAKGFDKPAEVAAGVSTRVKAMKAVNGEARGVGEVSGPALQFTLEVTNGTTEAISLAEAVVNVEAGADRFPAEELSGPGAVPFPAEVAPGQTVSGVFVFQIPPEQRKTVRVLFTYQAVLPVAAFEGSVPL